MCVPRSATDAGSQPIRGRPFVLLRLREVIGKERRTLGGEVGEHPLDRVGDPAVVLLGIRSDRMIQRFANQLVAKAVSGAELGQERLDDFGVDQPGETGDDVGSVSPRILAMTSRVSGSGRSRPSNDAICATCRSPPSRSTICAKIG